MTAGMRVEQRRTSKSKTGEWTEGGENVDVEADFGVT